MCIPALIAAVGSWLGAAGAGTAATAGATAATAGTAATASTAAASAASTAAVSTTVQAIAVGASIAATGLSVANSLRASNIAKQVGKNNQKVNQYAAEQERRRGELDAQEVQRRAAVLRGQQRSMLAARGLDLTTGTPSDIIDQTDFFGAVDASTARTNARRNAWGIENQGANMRMSARYDALQSRTQAVGSLVGGVGQVADRWYNFSGAA